MDIRFSSKLFLHFSYKTWLMCLTLLLTYNGVICSTPYFTTDTYPVIVFFTEGTATPPGTLLHQFHAVDDETGVVPFLNYTFDPVSGQNMFDITEVNTGTERVANVTLKFFKEFDYETHDTYKITVYAFDGILLSDGVLLTIQVNDTGETPTLNPPTDSQSFTIEENPAGTVVGHPSFTIMDTDGSSDYHVWTITGGNGTDILSINPLNGTITLTQDYDIDNTSYAEVIYVDVSIIDKYGLSVNLTYYVTITDKNDKIPQCDPDYYTFNVTRETSPGTLLVTINCTDDDLTSPNNEITYSFVPGNDYSEYWIINGADVEVAYVNDLIYGGGPYEIQVRATDGGSPAFTSTVTLIFTIPTATTLPPTTTLVPVPAYDEISSDDRLPLLFIVTGIIAGCIIGYIMILCWRWHTFGACLPKHCPTSRDCRTCCTCCPGDDDVTMDQILTEGIDSKGFVVKKGGSLGPEATNSLKQF